MATKNQENSHAAERVKIPVSHFGSHRGEGIYKLPREWSSSKALPEVTKGRPPMTHSAFLVLRLSSVWIAKNSSDLSSPDTAFLFVCTRRVGLVRVVYRSSHHSQHGICNSLIFKGDKFGENGSSLAIDSAYPAARWDNQR